MKDAAHSAQPAKIDKIEQELEASQHEHEPLLPQSNRIVVYGTGGNGALELVGHLQGILEHNDIEGRIDWTRDVALIETAFFHNRSPDEAPDDSEPTDPSMQHSSLDAPQTARGSLSQHVDDHSQLSTSTADLAAPEANQSETDPFSHTRPRGVLIFEDMRQYYNGMGMTVSGHTDVIVDLCQQNEVPYALVSRNDSGDDETKQAITALFALDQAPTVHEQLEPRPIKRDAASMVVEKSLREHAIRERVLADFDGEAPDAIFPLSGSIIQRKDGRYESVGSSDLSEHGLVTIGRARVIAGAEIAKLFPESAIVANSYNRFNPDEPTMASVVQDELRRRGIPEEQIILEEESFSTITQYVEMVKLAVEKKWTKLTILINEYYTPRATALFEHLDTIVQDDEFQRTLQEFKDMGAEVAFIESDEILGMMSERFTRHLDAVKQTPAYQETVAKEAQGLKDLLAGKYKFSPIPEKPRH